jgi:polysaccharide deacetylase family protein (PEP-CTERM system associated)
MQGHFASIDFEDWYADIEKVPGCFNDAFVRQYSSVVACLQQTGTKCTFFVLGRTAERYPELVLNLHRMGHEIASHGYAHERVDGQTPAQFAEDLDRSVEVIQQVISSSPVGYRAPFFSVTREQFWMYDILADRGFTYSSSIFPFAGKSYGVADFSLGPQRITTASGRVIVEYPLSVVEVLGRRFPVAGGGFWRLMPKFLIKGSVKSVAGHQRSFTSYLHPHEFDSESIHSHKGSLRNLYLNFGRRSIKGKFIDTLTTYAFQPFSAGTLHT